MWKLKVLETRSEIVPEFSSGVHEKICIMVQSEVRELNGERMRPFKRRRHMTRECRKAVSIIIAIA